MRVMPNASTMVPEASEYQVLRGHLLQAMIASKAPPAQSQRFLCDEHVSDVTSEAWVDEAGTDVASRQTFPIEK